MIMIMIMIMIRVILISQIGLDPATGELVEGVAQQTEVSLRNMMAIMEVRRRIGCGPWYIVYVWIL